MAAGPFVREFMFTVLRTIHSQNICYDDKVCINADLVPRVSERVMHASMKEREVRPKTKELREEIKMQESILQQPISPPSRLKKVSPQQPPQPPKPQRAM
ncbi:hypothetical protein HN630_00670, partial [archaeon]|nr:hypothetical protein [archaeon]